MTALTGTRTLVRLLLRRDRFLLPLWILWLGLIPVLQATAVTDLFPTQAQLETYARTLNTPALRAMYGPTFGSSLGAVTVGRAGFAPVVIALISLLTVIRHTRAEEEAGRRELLGSTVLGRHAGLAAALVVTVGANLALGAILAAGMIGVGEPVAGSIAFGLAYVLVGCTFAAAGGVAAQLTESAAATRGIAVGALGLAFVLRVGGDLSSEGSAWSWLSWLSPIGWGQQVRPYAGERWWVLGLAAAFALLLAAVAVRVSARRDVGGGVVPPRPGPAHAAAGLRSAPALAWRLQRGALAGWLAGFAVLGLVLGGASQGIGDMVADSPELEGIFAQLGGVEGLVDAYLAAMVGLFALIAAGYGIQAALRLRAEETSLRAEPILATGVSRLRWASGHVAFALLGPAAALAVGGLVTGLAHGLVAGDVAGELPRVLGGALVQLPAVWVLTGLAIALFGLRPGLAAAVSWGALSAVLFLTLLGPILQLDQRVLNLSPFAHVPDLPGGALTVAPLVWLAAAAALLVAAGFVGLRARDVPAV